MAPVAVETLVYKDTLVADPALPLRLLEAARRREATLGLDPDQGGWTSEEDQARCNGM